MFHTRGPVKVAVSTEVECKESNCKKCEPGVHPSNGSEKSGALPERNGAHLEGALYTPNTRSFGTCLDKTST